MAETWDDVAMLAAWGGDMARRLGQRASTKLDVVCCKVTTMEEARTNEPPLVPLSLVGYFALALEGAVLWFPAAAAQRARECLITHCSLRIHMKSGDASCCERNGV